MNVRFICVLAFCLGASSSVLASEQFGVLRRVSCSVVRFYVAKYSAPAAEQWARSKGATDADIEAARRCLSPGRVSAINTGLPLRDVPARLPVGRARPACA